MDKINKNTDIKNSEELYAYIAKQCLKHEDYTKTEILNYIKEKLRTSQLKISDKHLTEMINATLKFLERYQLIVLENGTYSKKTRKVTTSQML